jgi:hypothetical protein
MVQKTRKRVQKKERKGGGGGERGGFTPKKRKKKSKSRKKRRRRRRVEKKKAKIFSPFCLFFSRGQIDSRRALYTKERERKKKLKL